MSFTEEQLEAIRNGRSLRLKEGSTEIVVLRADVYERLRESLYDDSPWTDEEMDVLAAEDADFLGWRGMEVYQDDER